MNLGFILLAAVDCLPVDEWVAQTFLAYFRGQLNDLPQGLHLRLVTSGRSLSSDTGVRAGRRDI